MVVQELCRYMLYTHRYKDAKDGEPFGDGVTASVDDFDEIIIEDNDLDDFI